MRSMAPRLILTGDTHKAKSWSVWGTKWLTRLKNVLGETVPINKSAWVLPPNNSTSYRKGGGVLVQVSSVLGIDTIRIFAQPLTAGCSDTANFTIESITDLTVVIKIAEDLCVNNFFINWGDNQNQLRVGATTYPHTYERAGNYNITVTAWETDQVNSPDTAAVTWDLDFDGNRNVPFDLASNASCHDQLITDPLYNTYLEERLSHSTYRARFSFGFPIWSYWLGRARFNAQLSSLAGHPSLVTGKCFIYLSSAFTAYIAYDNDGASKPRMHYYSGSDMGMTMFESAAEPATSTIGSMIDNTIPMVDTVFGLLDQNQPEPVDAPPPILPDPADQDDFDTNFRWSGWEQYVFASMVPASIRINLLPYKSKKLKTLPVTVTEV